MSDREWCEANSWGYCEKHDREFTENPHGYPMCESCGWEAQAGGAAATNTEGAEQ